MGMARTRARGESKGMARASRTGAMGISKVICKYFLQMRIRFARVSFRFP